MDQILTTIMRALGLSFLKPLKDSENPEISGWLAYSGNFTNDQYIEDIIAREIENLNL